MDLFCRFAGVNCLDGWLEFLIKILIMQCVSKDLRDKSDIKI